MKQLLIWISIFTLFVMACGMSAGTQPEPKISIKVKTPTLEPAPAPLRSDAESTARACGSLWVREGAGIEYGRIAWALRGDTLTMTGETKTASDGGKWSQVLDRDGLIGWVNQRFLCGGEK